jgi:hypothetical protein
LDGEVEMKRQRVTVGCDVNNGDLAKAYEKILKDPEHKKNVKLVERAEKDFAEFVRAQQNDEGHEKR